MNTTHDAVVGRRSFLRRTAGITAGAAAFVAAGLNTETTLAAPAPSPAAVIQPAVGLTIELFELDKISKTMVGRFTSCTNIGSENEIIEHKVTDPTGKIVIQKIPGRLKYFNVTLSNGVGNNRPIIDWHRRIENGQTSDILKDVQIIVRNDVQELFRWRLIRAWPAEMTVRNDAPLVEFLTIACDKVVREL
ncbi:MAG: hypothetical protein AVDCRST_MAG93-8003 [uncultured Chloroflexia bacterium]|uniref:Phage tail protein n=1 Tax=uncultured Chloroflexia bacterium TaxID=1672391 RepID=A0A6J4MSW5_9CHLR|nr:MAG: hypothetical protein AVDCRST_MAG93-8003 [uncultured Chloroflexia bacterium]